MLRTGMAQIGTCKTKEADNHTKTCHHLQHCICGNAPLKLIQTVTLTLEQIPAHSHTAKGWAAVTDGSGSYITLGGTGPSDTYSVRNAGGGQAHDNLQPYATLYMWQRTA